MEQRDIIFCNVCRKETRHNIKATIGYADGVSYDNGGEEQFDYTGDVAYQLVECDFCRKWESVSYRYIKTREGFAQPNGEWYSFTVESDIYPVRLDASGFTATLDRHSVKRPDDIPIHIRQAYKEVVAAFNADLLLLCAAGLRAIVEALCNHAGVATKNPNGQSNTLGWRIRQLESKKLIPKALADALQEHKELGNVALHSLHVPDREAIKIAVELVETALSNMFSVERQHGELKDRMMNSVDGK